MKILVLSPEAVVPPNTGGRIVVYNRIKYLKNLGNEVILLNVVDSDEEMLLQKQKLDELGIESHCFNRNNHKMLNLMKSLFLPYSVASRTSQHIRKQFLRTVEDYKSLDCIMVDFPQMLFNIPYKIRCKVILVQHNIEYLTMRNNGRVQKNLFRYLAYMVDSYRLEWLEKSIYHKKMLSAVAFVSADDKSFFEKNLNYRSIRSILLPIGADSHDKVDINNNGNNVLIVGKMSYVPNIEGVLWFCNKVWNHVKNAVPDAHLYIVGKDPVPKLLNLASDDIIVTGTVASVDEYYKKSSVAVIPLFSGGGVKTKLIEAASYRIPVICTTSGVKGTMFRRDEHILISDDELQFADMVIDTLINRESAKKRADRCYDCFIQNYQWSTIIKNLVNTINLF